MTRVFSRKAGETKQIAARLTRRLIQTGSLPKKPLVFALSGTLGSGKTTFVQGFLKSLGVRSRVVSPTFLIFRVYQLRRGIPYRRVYHIDLYRIRSVKELRVLGFREILQNPEHIILIEWPEKVRRILPRGTHWISFSHVGPTKRLIQITL